MPSIDMMPFAVRLNRAGWGMVRALCAVLLAVSVSTVAARGTVVLTDATTSQGLGRTFDILEDAKNAYILSDVIDPANALRFEPSQVDAPNFGFTDSTYWFRAQVRNDSSLERWMLSISYPLLDEVSVFLVGPGGVNSRLIAGHEEAADGTVRIRGAAAVELDLARGEQATIYLRTRTANSHVVPVSLWQTPAYTAYSEALHLVLGIYYGIVIAMLIYNFMLFVSVRDRAYLYYVAYIFFFTLLLASVNGLASEYLWPHADWWGSRVRPLAVALASLVGIQFTRALLDTRIHLPKADRFLVGIMFVCACAALLSLIAPYIVAVQVATGLGLLAAVALLLCGWACWRARVAIALYYVVAWSLFLLGCIMYALMSYGILPTNFMTEHAIQIGSALEVLLLSFALAFRIKLLKEENEHMHREAKAGLEARVIERTEELRHALLQLSAANEQLSQLSEEDKLTGAKNRHYFDSRFHEDWRNATRGNDSIALLIMDIDHFKRINDVHGHMFGDEVLQAVAAAIRATLARSADEVVRFGGEEFVVILPHTDLAGALDVGQRIKRSIDGLRFDSNGTAVEVRISMGVAATYPRPGQDGAWLLKRADEALYSAKGAGRNRIVAYEPTQQPEFAAG